MALVSFAFPFLSVCWSLYVRQTLSGPFCIKIDVSKWHANEEELLHQLMWWCWCHLIWFVFFAICTLTHLLGLCFGFVVCFLSLCWFLWKWLIKYLTDVFSGWMVQMFRWAIHSSMQFPNAMEWTHVYKVVNISRQTH